MSEPTFDPTPRPALQPRPRPQAAPTEQIAPAEPAAAVEPAVVTPEPAAVPAAPAVAPEIRVKVTGKAGKKKRKVDGKRFGRGSTADTQVAPKAKRVKTTVRLPKSLRTELADEAAELGISFDDYITNILRSR